MHIFDHTIKPILLYCAEVTFDFNPCSKKSFEDFKCESVLEKPHKKFLRYMLGLNNKSSIDALYGDTGRYPLYIEMIKRMLKYEDKLEKSGPETLLHHAHIENKKLADKGIHTWSFRTQHIKRSLQCNMPPNNSNKCITKKLKERFVHQWYDRIHNDTRTKPSERNKLRTYRKYKNIYKREPYLDCIKNYKTRSNFCRFRISAHNLHIETGRHTRVDVNERICKKCVLNEIEDEKHALMICPKYQNIRETVFNEIASTNSNFQNLDMEGKFVWLLSNEDNHTIAQISKVINIIIET